MFVFVSGRKGKKLRGWVGCAWVDVCVEVKKVGLCWCVRGGGERLMNNEDENDGFETNVLHHGPHLSGLWAPIYQPILIT